MPQSDGSIKAYPYSCGKCFELIENKTITEANCATRICKSAHAQSHEVSQAILLWQSLRASTTIPATEIIKAMGLSDLATFELLSTLDWEWQRIQDEARELQRRYTKNKPKPQPRRGR